MEVRGELLCEVRGHVGVITLNRPEVLNALNLSMISAMHRQLRDWAADKEIRAVVVRGAGTRAFCAGGDVRAVFDARGDDAFMDRVYRYEYELDEYINRYPKPYVALMAGYTMGGGCGISVNGKYRVVTETTTLAMPEVAIGLFPDVAASFFLARCPGATGLYLGLTGARVGGSDAIHLGLADYLLEGASLGRLVERLADGATVERAFTGLSVHPDAGNIARLRADIDACFGLDCVEQILRPLKMQTGAWAGEALQAMQAASPTSLAIAFRAISEGRAKSMRDCLITDFRIAQRLMRHGDYFEGVRALIVDKDRKPKWNPSSLSEVRREVIDRYFAPLASGDLRFS